MSGERLLFEDVIKQRLVQMWLWTILCACNIEPQPATLLRAPKMEGMIMNLSLWSERCVLLFSDFFTAYDDWNKQSSHSAVFEE